nr:hypothetical protein [Tanacetum cinerariifolium]
PGLEHPPSPVEIPYVPEPEYPEYLAPSDDEAPLKDQPLPVNASPTAVSLGYVADSDPEEDPEDDHADYPAEGEDDDDEPSNDDDDKDDTNDEDEETFEDEEDEEEEEEEHLDSAESYVVPIVDHTVRLEPSMSASMKAFIAKHAALLSPPLLVPSPPLPLPSPLTTSLTDTGAPLGYRAAGIRMRTLLPSTSRRTDIPEADVPPRKRACLTTLVWHKMSPKKRTTRATPATTTTPTTTVTDAQLQALIDRGVAVALAEHDTDRSRNDDNINDSGTGRIRQVTTQRECTYTDFLKCQPMSFQGTEGVVGLTQWLEKIEYVFQISNCTVTCQVKFASCTLQGGALTWWNSHMRAVRQDVAYVMPWADLKRMITDKYCPKGEIQKLESEYWNLKVKGLDLLNYNQRFQELALMYDRMFPEESTKVERYIGGLPDIIHGSVKPMSFQGTEGVVGLTQWLEKIEYVFQISNCTVTCQVKFASCTLQGSALTWWNSHMRAVRQDVAYAMPWVDLKRMITDKYCPRGEIQKLESEYWNLKVKGLDLLNYNQRFQELALMCDRMFPEESTKVERYIGGLPGMIHGSVKVSKPQSMQEAIKFAPEIMDKKININSSHLKGIMWHELTLLGQEIRSLMEEPNLYVLSEIITMMGHVHQRNRAGNRNAMARAYAVGTVRTNPKSNVVTGRPAATNNNNNNNTTNTNKNNHMAQGANARGITCFECGVQRHYKSDCPMLKNENQRNRSGNRNAMARAYAVGPVRTNPKSNVVTGTFLLNNRYALILFDTGADRSFISTTFSSLINIIPTTLDHGYDVELADGRIIWVNTLIRGCTLNFLNHPFNIDLMPVEIGSFDVIISMDWLIKHHAVIVCDEKLVRVPFDNKILNFHGDGSNNGHESRLNIISCTKTRKYLLKGCPIFLAHVTMKEAKDKSKEKRLEDVP